MSEGPPGKWGPLYSMPARIKWGVFRKLNRSFLEGLEESRRPWLGLRVAHGGLS